MSDNIRSAFIETIRFLIVEEHWECFREEFLSGSDEKKTNVSAQNAEKLRRFIRDLGERDPLVKECVKEASQ